MENPFEQLLQDLRELKADVTVIKSRLEAKEPVQPRKPLRGMRAICQYVGLKESTGYKSKDMPVSKSGKSVVAHPDDLDRWMLRNKVNPEPPALTSTIYTRKRTARPTSGTPSSATGT